MQAIVCKFLRPTNTKGPRVKATCAAGSLTVGYYSSDRNDPYQDAAEALCAKLGWVSTPNNLYSTLVRGELPDGSIVFTFVPKAFDQALQAVFEARLAISKGENNGNPHGRPWGKAITYLTDDGGSMQEQYETFKKSRWAVGEVLDGMRKLEVTRGEPK